jgi:hypothetical protein
MEEYKKSRVEKCERSEVCVEAKNASFSWGFRVKETQNVKAIKVDIEEVEEATIRGINFKLK